MWFYDVKADGFSLDDKRTPLDAGDHTKNNLPDVAWRYKVRAGSETENPRTAQSFCVPKAEIVGQGYDLSINRYKEVVHEEVDHRKPAEILKELGEMEGEISAGMQGLGEMLK